MKFTYGDKTFSNIEEYEKYFTDTIDANDENRTRTLTVNWEWPYDSEDDETDTAEGLQALNYEFDIVVTGTQVVPQK